MYYGNKIYILNYETKGVSTGWIVLIRFNKWSKGCKFLKYNKYDTLFIVFNNLCIKKEKRNVIILSIF